MPGVMDDSCPVGVIKDYASNVSIPPGWLNCNGQAVPRVLYANLFAIIGVLHGSGDGSTTFNLPDLRGRVTAGLDAGANRLTNSMSGGTFAATGGTDTHTLSASESGQPSGTVTANGGHLHRALGNSSGGGLTNLFGGPSHGFAGISVGGADSYGSLATATSGQLIESVSDHSHTINSASAASSHIITQPTMVLMKIIKY